MDINQFTAEVNAVNWHCFSGPEHYRPESVPAALISLALAQESKESLDNFKDMDFGFLSQERDLLLNSSIASDVKFSVGNDHSGSYYPAVRMALPFIIHVSLFGNHLVARNCAINILIDLYYHCPDCTGTDVDPEELQKFLRGTIKKTIVENAENFRQFAIENEGNDSLIKSLLGIVEPNEVE